MSDKVRLPKKVADGLNMLLETGAPNIEIVSTILGNAVHPKQMPLVKYVNDGGFTNIMSALVNGYEVEETPEDKLIAYYNDQAGKTAALQDSSHYVIKYTLELLNIKIEGLNA